MVNVIGWTPTSQKQDPETTFLSQFTNPFERREVGDENYPRARSGHRCFTDNDYFYLIGGFTTKIFRGAIFREFWAMSLATFEWRRYKVHGELPSRLASTSIIQTSTFSKSFILFGGSGTVFGDSSSNDFFLVRVNNEDCSIHSQRVRPQGDIPRPMYGHAMCAGEVPGKYYIIGGTDGVIFNFHIYALTMKANTDPTSQEFLWHCKLLTRNPNFSGRYRLEATYDEKTERLLFFGGGNGEEVISLEKVATFHVIHHKTTEVKTIPDPVAGYPVPRRCISLGRYKRKLVIAGGANFMIERRREAVYSDVWIFDLDNYSWQKYQHSLPRRSYFHDSVMTQDGWFLTFGGLDGLERTAKRNNVMYSAWFGVPTLGRLALESLRSSYPHMFSGLYCGNMRSSQLMEIASNFCKPETIHEKERRIIERGKVEFRVKLDRSRHFFNEHVETFVTSKLEKSQWKRRESEEICVFVENGHAHLDENVLKAMEFLMNQRKMIGEARICFEIDKLEKIWKSVHEPDQQLNLRRIRRRPRPQQMPAMPRPQMPMPPPIVRPNPAQVMYPLRGAEIFQIRFNRLMERMFNPRVEENENGENDSSESESEEEEVNAEN